MASLRCLLLSARRAPPDGCASTAIETSMMISRSGHVSYPEETRRSNCDARRWMIWYLGPRTRPSKCPTTETVQTMRIKVDCLPEPGLRFGDSVTGWEPKAALAGRERVSGVAGTSVIRLGLVALSDEVAAVRKWFERMEGLILSSETNARRFREFPGTRRVFNYGYDLPDGFVKRVDRNDY